MRRIGRWIREKLVQTQFEVVLTYELVHFTWMLGANLWHQIDQGLGQGQGSGAEENTRQRYRVVYIPAKVNFVISAGSDPRSDLVCNGRVRSES